MCVCVCVCACVCLCFTPSSMTFIWHTSVFIWSESSCRRRKNFIFYLIKFFIILLSALRNNDKDSIRLQFKLCTLLIDTNCCNRYSRFSYSNWIFKEATNLLFALFLFTNKIVYNRWVGRDPLLYYSLSLFGSPNLRLSGILVAKCCFILFCGSQLPESQWFKN